MAQEIERKFKVIGQSYKELAVSHTNIAQGYLCTDTGRTVRVRIRNDRGYLTIKGPSVDNGLSRFEWEREIALADAQQLLNLCLPGVIRKTRYLVPAGRHTFEVDEFFGDNEGLVMAEVELSHPDESYERPSFLGEEVTGDRRYYNSSLTKHPFKDWSL